MTRHAQIRRSELKSTKRSSSSKRASTSFKVNASTEDDDDDFVPAQDSSLFRQQDGDAGVKRPVCSGNWSLTFRLLGEKALRIRTEDRPGSRTLTEGRYKRPKTVRVGNVDEATVLGEDFEVAEGGPGIGLLFTLLFGAAVLGGVYLTVQKLAEEPPAATKKKTIETHAGER